MNFTNKTDVSIEIENAYKYCETVTKTHAKSFYFAAKFLPKNKRRPIYALYALCRSVDDAVDEAEISDENEAVEAVELWKEKLEKLYADAAVLDGEKGRRGERKTRRKEDEEKAESATVTNEGQKSKTDNQNLVLSAWRDILKTYKIPRELPIELMKGVLMDTHIKRYETFDELYVYCYRVASTVGLMSSEIFGYEKPETLEYAESLGIAMQLTNILRDVKEDAAMSRIYLPQEDLRKFNVTEKQIFDNDLDGNFIELMKFEIGRARRFYRKAERGIPFLEKDARFTVLLASRIYARILDEIERQNYDVFARRAHTTARQKFFSIARVWREAGKL